MYIRTAIVMVPGQPTRFEPAFPCDHESLYKFVGGFLQYTSVAPDVLRDLQERFGELVCPDELEHTRDVRMVINEQGLRHRLPVNLVAGTLYNGYGRDFSPVLGPAALLWID